MATTTEENSTSTSIFIESISTMTTNELANTLWSLGMRKTQWNIIRNGVGSIVLKRFTMIGKEMSSYEFAWSIWAFARMGIRWSEDFNEDQRSEIMQIASDIVNVLSDQEIGVLLWALVKLQTPPHEFSRSLKQLFVDNIEYILMMKNT